MRHLLSKLDVWIRWKHENAKAYETLVDFCFLIGFSFGIVGMSSIVFLLYLFSQLPR